MCLCSVNKLNNAQHRRAQPAHASDGHNKVTGTKSQQKLQQTQRKIQFESQYASSLWAFFPREFVMLVE